MKQILIILPFLKYSEIHSPAFGFSFLLKLSSHILVIAAEFMGAQSGLGYLIMLARRTLQTDAILVGIIIIGITSWIVDRMVRIIGDYLTRWAPRIE